MTIKPTGSPFTFAGATVYLDRASKKADQEKFQRAEFKAERLKTVKNANGTREVFNITNGYEYQYENSCNAGSTDRPIGPDNPDDVFRRWDIVRWELAGLPSDAADLETINDVFQDHLALYGAYQSHLQIAESGDIAYQDLEAMQLEDFSYLTTTGVDASGMAIGTGEELELTDILIRSFVQEVEYEVPGDAEYETSEVLRSWSAVIETRVNVPDRSSTWNNA